jgi:hypothetical protein
MSSVTDSRIPVSRPTRKRLKALKRGGETYDRLLNKMAEQYDPEAVEHTSANGETDKTEG